MYKQTSRIETSLYNLNITDVFLLSFNLQSFKQS